MRVEAAIALIFLQAYILSGEQTFLSQLGQNAAELTEFTQTTQFKTQADGSVVYEYNCQTDGYFIQYDGWHNATSGTFVYGLKLKLKEGNSGKYFDGMCFFTSYPDYSWWNVDTFDLHQGCSKDEIVTCDEAGFYFNYLDFTPT
jgi:hypothetical protein